MDNKPNMRWRKVIARLYVSMVYEPENEKRDLRFIHKHFIREHLGIAYKTFLAYLDEEKDDLSDLVPSPAVVRSIWDCVNYKFALLDHRTVDLPDALVDRLGIFEGYKKRMQMEKTSEHAGIERAEDAGTSLETEAVEP